MLKSLNSFDLVRCSRLEKFPNIHPEMKCLRDLDLQESGIRELPSSIGYLGGLTKLCLRDCSNLRLRLGVHKEMEWNRMIIREWKEME